MSENRIQINGTWYIREDAVKEAAIEVKDVTWFNGAVYENDEICFEATILTKEDGSEYSKHSEPSIQYTDKTVDRDKRKDDYIDNPVYLLGLVEDDPESLSDVKTYLNPRQIAHLKAFINILIEKGWFKNVKRNEQ